MITKKEMKEKLTTFLLHLLEVGAILAVSFYFIVMFIIGFALFGYQSNLVLYLAIVLGSFVGITISLIVRKNVRTKAANKDYIAGVCLSR
jgi:predicted membrane-bound spermidine synthase